MDISVCSSIFQLVDGELIFFFFSPFLASHSIWSSWAKDQAAVMAFAAAVTMPDPLPHFEGQGWNLPPGAAERHRFPCATVGTPCLGLVWVPSLLDPGFEPHFQVCDRIHLRKLFWATDHLGPASDSSSPVSLWGSILPLSPGTDGRGALILEWPGGWVGPEEEKLGS